ncbi:uncharacterized protein [Halyomorpha halys]|uniref:uncharacterized protein n=1 Tax=Halyomorpha halys TaxID=286706 RepID=UPI0034D316A8
MPREGFFIECAQELIDTSAREKETRIDVEEPGWRRTTPPPLRKRKYKYSGREKMLKRENADKTASVMVAAKVGTWWSNVPELGVRGVPQDEIDQHPPCAAQEETPTANAPLCNLQVDSFVWKSYKWVTVIDVFSKVAMTHQVRDRSAEAVLRVLWTCFQFYGVPERISSDSGREFDNASIREKMRCGASTRGVPHPKSRGVIERLHR